MKPSTWHQKLQYAVSRLDKHQLDGQPDRWWRSGVVASPQGYAYAYSQAGITSIRVIRKGVEYCYTWQTTLTPRQIAIKAGKLLRGEM